MHDGGEVLLHSICRRVAILRPLGRKTGDDALEHRTGGVIDTERWDRRFDVLLDDSVN